MLLENLPDVLALEHAQPHRREGGDRMVHLSHDRGLQPDQIARQHEVQDLRPAILGALGTVSPARQNGIKVGRTRPFVQHERASLDVEFPALEAGDEFHLFLQAFSKERQRSQRAFRTSYAFHRETLLFGNMAGLT